MVQYLNRWLPFQVRRTNLEFIQKGQVDSSSFWLWAFYGDNEHRWNLCVFSGPDPFDGPTRRTWMCADNNPYDLNDRAYITAIHNQEY